MVCPSVLDTKNHQACVSRLIDGSTSAHSKYAAPQGLLAMPRLQTNFCNGARPVLLFMLLKACRMSSSRAAGMTQQGAEPRKHSPSIRAAWSLLHTDHACQQKAMSLSNLAVRRQLYLTDHALCAYCKLDNMISTNVGPLMVSKPLTASALPER